MTFTIEATYENGVLKPAQPLPLKEQEQVQVTISPTLAPTAATGDVVQNSFGLLGWQGTHEELEQILAEADEFEGRP